jgi:hypothetical protein
MKHLISSVFPLVTDQIDRINQILRGESGNPSSCAVDCFQSRVSNANSVALHYILAYVNNQAAEHTRITLELYRAFFNRIKTIEKKDNAQRMAMELAEKPLEKALKLEGKRLRC